MSQSDSISTAATDPTGSTAIELSRIWVTAPGAVILLTTVAFVAFLIVVLTPRLRNGIGSFFSGRRLQASLGPATIDLTPTGSEEGTRDAGSASQVKPPDTAPGQEVARSEAALRASTASPEELPADENAQFLAMLDGAYLKRDAVQLEEAYIALRDRPDRRISAEDLEALRADLRLDIGVSSAESDLLDLASRNKTWIEPNLRLARYYLKLGSFSPDYSRHIGI